MRESGKKKLKNSSVLNEFHQQIGKLQDGTDRLCDKCGTIYSNENFQFKTVNTCIYCYKRNGSVSKNYKVNQRSNVQEVHLDEIDISDKINQCGHCKSYNIITKGNSLTTKRLVCTDCGGILQYLHKKVSRGLVSNTDTLIGKSKLSEPFDDNVRIDQIMKEIQYKKDKNLPLIIYYKDDTVSTRTFYDYYVFGKYLKVKGKDHYYTYLLKDIREIL